MEFRIQTTDRPLARRPLDEEYSTDNRAKTPRGALRHLRAWKAEAAAGGPGTWAFNVRCVDEEGKEYRESDLEFMISK